jgi:hypothetical protein
LESNWSRTEQLDNKVFHCAFCGTKVTSAIGYWNDYSSKGIWICPCDKPTFFDGIIQYPQCPFGNSIDGIDSHEVSQLYEEARNCTSARAYTSAVLTCRKILMHIAVEKGAEKDQSFMGYVEYLSDKHYIPPDGKDWVDQIRTKSNEANHEIILMTKQDAEEIVGFTEMLLRFIYEFPKKVRRDKK